MAGKLGQGKLQKLILRELETNPVLSLRSLNPEGKRSRRKALHRSVKKLVQRGVLERVKVIVPNPSGPIVYDAVVRSGSYILGMQIVSQNDIVQPVQEISKTDGDGAKLSLDERIQRLQVRINS